MANKPFLAQFFGVRGSVPAPLKPSDVSAKIATAVELALTALPRDASAEQVHTWLSSLAFPRRSTFGGNTTCVLVTCGEEIFILDMGTGLREAGLALMPKTCANKGIHGTVLLSHVHWDHIQGMPFWPELFMPREVFDNCFVFYGGKNYERSLDAILRGQMDQPVFPVSIGELDTMAMRMEFNGVHDRLTFNVGDVHIRCRKLHHPQETFGYRLEYGGRVLAFTTDHEPYAAPDPALVELVSGADVWITDCQYSQHIYSGKEGGVPRLGWGHSFPESLAEVAAIAAPRRIVTTHHDPAATDDHVVKLAEQLLTLSGTATEPAHEGLTIAL